MHVARWGNCLAVRLPKKFVDELGLKPGDQIDIVSTVGRRVEVCLNPQPERELAPIEPNGSPTSEA
jgi:antitoxin MazE